MENKIEKLINFFSRELLEGSKEGLTEETPLMELGIIDSLSILKIIAFIEKEFAVKIDVGDMIPENFENIKIIIRLVESKTK